MIESGIVQLVQADATVLSLAPVGGFYAQLPKLQALPCWSYLYVSDVPTYTLQGVDNLTNRRLQIDVFGDTDVNTLTLATAIDQVLSGYAGTLSESTVVQGIFRTNVIDFFDPDARTYRRLLEYSVWFVA